MFHLDVQSLAGSIAQYSDYLNRQNKKMLLQHESVVPIRTLANSVTLPYHKATRLTLFPQFLELDSLLENAAE